MIPDRDPNTALPGRRMTYEEWLELNITPLRLRAFERSAAMRTAAQSRFLSVLLGLLKTTVRRCGSAWTMHTRTRLPAGKVVFYYISRNNLDALRDVRELFHGEAVLLTPRHSMIEEYYHPEAGYSVRSWRYVGRFLSFYLRSPRPVREVIRAYAPDYFFSFGLMDRIGAYVDAAAPKAVVVSNDHNMECRGLVRACKARRIPTFYIQHACVTERFPRLEVDLALLDGEDARKKYLGAGSDPRSIVVTGMPKFDRYVHLQNRFPEEFTVGICSNRTIDPASMEQLIRSLIREIPDVRIVFRPHPGEDHEAYRTLRQLDGIAFSDSTKENAFEFVGRVNIVIAGNSGILLEAALLNRWPVYLDLDGTRSDGYGFLRNGLAEYAATIDDLTGTIVRCRKGDTTRSPVQRAAWYCDTADGEGKGTASQRAVTIITERIELQQNGTVL